MIQEASDLKEISDFHFSQLRTLRIAKHNEKVPPNAVNIIAAASKYGLLFVGIESGFKVLKLENILDLDEDKENKNIEENYYSQLVPSKTPTLLLLSADQKTLAVCVMSNSSAVADMYDIAAFADPDEKPVPFLNVQLSSNGDELKEFSWNPANDAMYAFCLSDGSLHVHELTGTKLSIVASLPAQTGAVAVCWSPKGKQVVVGKKDGSLSQYKPTLQEMKVIPCPKLENTTLTVSNVCWISTTLFAVVYASNEEKLPYFMMVSTPKGQPISYTNYYDVCLGNGTSPQQRYLMHYEAGWNILTCASSDSIEISILGASPDWVQWDLKEDGKALLPGKDGANHAVGMGVMYCAQRKIVISETESYSPMPIVFFLTDNGLLVSFHMINTATSAATLVRPSTPIEREGERKRIEPASPPPPQNAITPKPVELKIPTFPAASVPPLAPSQASNQVVFGLRPTGERQLPAIPVSTPPIFSSWTPRPTLPLIGSLFSTPPPPPPSVVSSSSSSFPALAEKAPLDTSTLFKRIQTVHEKVDNITESQNTYMAAILEEMRSFEKELQELREALRWPTEVGTLQEMAHLRSSVLSLQDFQKSLVDNMMSLNRDIGLLKGAALEAFAMVEEGYSWERCKKKWQWCLPLALDPLTARHMRDLEQRFQYVSSQLLEVNNRLDQEWARPLPSNEAIYRTILNNQRIIHHLRVTLQALSHPRRRTKVVKGELSKLADSLLHLTVPEEEKAKKKQAYLRRFLSQRPLSVVKPTRVYSPSHSRLISRCSFFTTDTKVAEEPKVISPPKPSASIYEDISPPVTPFKEQPEGTVFEVSSSTDGKAIVHPIVENAQNKEAVPTKTSFFADTFNPITDAKTPLRAPDFTIGKDSKLTTDLPTFVTSASASVGTSIFVAPPTSLFNVLPTTSTPPSFSLKKNPITVVSTSQSENVSPFTINSSNMPTFNKIEDDAPAVILTSSTTIGSSFSSLPPCQAFSQPSNVGRAFEQFTMPFKSMPPVTSAAAEVTITPIVVSPSQEMLSNTETAVTSSSPKITTASSIVTTAVSSVTVTPVSPPTSSFIPAFGNVSQSASSPITLSQEVDITPKLSSPKKEAETPIVVPSVPVLEEGDSKCDQVSFFGQVTSASLFSTPFGTTTSTAPVFEQKSSFFGQAVVTQPSFFSKSETLFGPVSQPQTFGQTTATNAASPFGEGAKTFFSQPAVSGAPAFGSNTFGSQGFSFGKTSFGQQTTSSFGLAKTVFGQNTSVFGQTASSNSSTFGQSSSTLFGQSSFFGLGAKPNAENASKNVFGSGSLEKAGDNSMFGSEGASTFGTKTGGSFSGNFSGGAGSVAQSGFGAFQQPAQKSGGFGAPPAFGGSPTFGGTSSFGSPPAFGGSSSLFGGQANFSSFASTAPTFGSLASQTTGFGSPAPPLQTGFGQQSSPFAAAPVFGSSFAGQSGTFGNSGSPQANSSAFTQWRN